MKHPQNNTLARLSGLAVTALVAAACPLHATDIHFDNYTSPSDNDLVNRFLAGGTFQQLMGGGITGGSIGSQAIEGGYATYRYPQSAPTTISIAFFYDFVDTTPFIGMGGASVRLGWTGDLASVDYFQPTTYFWGEFANDGSFSVMNNPTGQGFQGTFLSVGSIPAPSFGHWLKFSFTAERTGLSSYSFGVRLDDLGTTGLDSPSMLFSGSTGANNSVAAADTSIYPGVVGWYNAPRYDNFSGLAVPEPGSIILLGFGATLFGKRIRNRRI